MNAIFLLAGLSQLTLAITALRLRARNPLAAVVLAILGVAIAYDNIVVGLGSSIGAGSLLQALSFARFALHGLLTPILLVGCAALLQQHRVRTRVFGRTPMAVTAVVLILIGVALDLVGLELAPETAGEVLRYTDVEASAPIPTILTILLAVAMGVRLLRSGGPPWLLVGATLMLITGAAPSDGAPVLANLGEVALLAGAVATMAKSPTSSSPSESSVHASSIQPGG